VAQVPCCSGPPYGVVGLLGRVLGPVGDHEGQVEAADPATVRAQQPVQIGGHPQYLAPRLGIVAVTVASYGVLHVRDQVRQEEGRLREPVLRALPRAPRPLDPFPQLCRVRQQRPG
jgi:hypothetical protein